MKALALLVSLLAVASLAACSSSGNAPAGAATPSADTQSGPAFARGETEARALVELFGSRLQNLSLQSPNVAQAMSVQYSGLVTPKLLHRWEASPTHAPGRYLSSPWPDHIQITALTFHGSQSCSVSGRIVMMTSAEVAGGGVAALVPAHLELRMLAGRWLITGFTPQRPID